MMTDFCRAFPGAGDSARQRNTSANVNPPSDKAPACRKLRRVTPSQSLNVAASVLANE
jgi:hypothetical protein